MKRWKWGALLLCVAVLLTGCAEREAEQMEVPELLEPVGVSMDSAQVVRGDIYTVQTFEASVAPATEELSFERDGEIASLNVVVGQSVKKGEVLAELDEEELEEQYELLTLEMERQETLNEYDNRALELDIQAKTIQNEALKGSATPDGLQSAALELEALELELTQQKQRQALAMRQMEEQISALSEKMGMNQLVAPCDGVVSWLAEVRAGSQITAYAPMIYVADDSRLSIVSEYMSEQSAASADRLYARIGDTDYPIELQPMDMQEYITVVLAGGTPTSRFSLDAQDAAGLEAGQYAMVYLVTGTKEDVLLIPSNALYSDSEGRYVYRLEDGRRVRCPVTTGRSNQIQVEITEGLNEGDWVYVKE